MRYLSELLQMAFNFKIFWAVLRNHSGISISNLIDMSCVAGSRCINLAFLKN